MTRSLVLASAVAVAAGGCASVEQSFVQTLPADGVTRAFCDLERGSVVYSGSAPDAFEVEVAPWASGITRGAADAALGTTRWGVTVADGLLDLWSRTRVARTGVDFVVEGPPAIDAEIVLLDGDAALYDLTGRQLVTADRITGEGLVGDLDLYATGGGVDVEALPEPGAAITIESVGDTVLRLPYGGDYDLEVFADPDWGADVTDLGFDSLRSAPDYVRATTGSGSIRRDRVRRRVRPVGGRPVVPTSTARYRFEFRLHDWARQLSVGLCGKRAAFFLGMRDDGSIRRIYFAPSGEPFDGATKTQLAEAHPKWFLYLPYDDDGAYLEWLGVDRKLAERWIGRKLEAVDFLDVRSTGAREEWPESWRVIVS
ncbi:MAG: hypothetical protein ABMB14_21655 [Myxococcota bacterium]